MACLSTNTTSVLITFTACSLLLVAVDIDDCASSACNATFTNRCEDKWNAYECHCKSCDCSDATRNEHCTVGTYFIHRSSLPFRLDCLHVTDL